MVLYPDGARRRGKWQSVILSFCDCALRRCINIESLMCWDRFCRPDLTDDPEWEQMPIMATISRAGMDCKFTRVRKYSTHLNSRIPGPVNMVTSRNYVLLCAIALCRMSIYTLPKQLTKISISGGTYIPPFHNILNLIALRFYSEKHLTSFRGTCYFSPIAQIDSGHCSCPCCSCGAIGYCCGYREGDVAGV